MKGGGLKLPFGPSFPFLSNSVAYRLCADNRLDWYPEEMFRMSTCDNHALIMLASYSYVTFQVIHIYEFDYEETWKVLLLMLNFTRINLSFFKDHILVGIFAAYLQLLRGTKYTQFLIPSDAGRNSRLRM